ncbi:MAG: multidrug efflux RND transporter permease subunit [Deltaproteobacteria bacterium]|nr:multidrug efflux RND transporter permease subunit [Deltaproteobacteria bacterium]
MFSRIFIERPILAGVIAIVIVLSGVVTLPTLPVAQYPEITPPTVKVSTTYPGANAVVVANTVAAPIEQQVNGVEGMIYMSSTSANDGSYALTVTFEVGTDLDMAQVLVQNRVAIAEARLPEEVKRQGVTTKKQSTSIVLLITLTAQEGEYDTLFLSNYATLRLADELKRIQGVGEVTIFGGSDYSMRIWLDPEKLKSRGLTAQDVTTAIREQNVQVAAGQIGQPPAPSGQSFQYAINSLGRLQDLEQFEQIILKTGEMGRISRLRDVARVELGGQNYNQFAALNGDPCAAISIYQLPGANALDVAAAVRAAMDRLDANFPAGLEWSIPFDTTKAVEASITEVYETLFIAIALVFLTIFVFLQDWRATLIPAVTIPVSLIGTFTVMAVLGFSINMLSLFGLVLAIGIVVDDAIVVVENVTRLIDEQGMSGRDAALQAMQEVGGPIVATTLVLLAVFVPAAFLGGITGQLNQQFALTIAAATVISSINALTLSPALSALLLRPTQERRTGFFGAFNASFDRGSTWYVATVERVVRRVGLSMVLFAALVALAGWGFMALPTGFLPTEDQGYFFAAAQLPEAASLERASEVSELMEKALIETPGIRDVVTITGYSLLDGSSLSNAVTVFVVMDPWEERTDASLQQEAILGDLRRRFYEIQEGFTFAFIPPAINGLGVSGGFQMQLQDRGDVGFDALQQVAMEMVADGNAQSGLQALKTTFRARVPQLFADVDRTKAKTLGVPLDAVFGTLQTSLGSSYVNDFNKFGRTYQVIVQVDSRFRQHREDIQKLDVRNDDGEMIPLGTLVEVEDSFGPQLVVRYNLYPSAAINGEAAAGFSSGDALALMEQMARNKLPQSMGFDWTGMSYQEKKVGGEAIAIFGLAILLVFLVLAAQYESWSAPAAVIFAVPLGLFGAVVAASMRALANDVYMQIGVVLLVALASKNAILIVEFAREKRSEGLGILEAAVEASRLRFRPILMTSFSFVLGVMPLVVASGAGAASRRSLGTVVLGGQLSATVIAVVLVPVFFVVFQSLGERGARKGEEIPTE